MNPSGLPLTHNDMASLVARYPTLRLAGMSLRVLADHQDFPEMLEVSEPWQREVRWSVYRDMVGLVLDDWVDSSRQRLDTMDEVLCLIWDTAEEDRQEAIAAIPETLVPNVSL